VTKGNGLLIKGGLFTFPVSFFDGFETIEKPGDFHHPQKDDGLF
jgi:hypothetical protein